MHAELADALLIEGKVAVVTGAGSGLGRETARILALAGATVALIDVNEEGLEGTRALIDGPATSHRVDVSSREQVEALADRVLADTGRLDIWVNCAGLGYMHPLLETDAARAERLIAVNMMGAYWCTAAAARVMRESGGGAIVNISSGGGSAPVPGIAIYGMTKAAVNSLTWTSAAELGPLGIRVNAIEPGYFETPMSSAMYSDAAGVPIPGARDALFQQMSARTPLGRTGNPSEIAHAVLYLASDASCFVTGHILKVNGGMGM